MASEKKDRTTTLIDLNKDVISIISKTLETESSRSHLARSHRFFGKSEVQKNRIIARLDRFAADGKFDQIVKLIKIRPDLRQQVLFALAGSAEQNKMQDILKEHPELLLVYAPLIDISGARFERITLFQHAIWAGDMRYMANMMLDCLPANAQGEMIRLELVNQLVELKEKGVTYVYEGKGKQCKDSQLSLEPCIAALKQFSLEFHAWDQTKREHYWCTVVGQAQRRLPAHVRHHYCEPGALFDNEMAFLATSLNRTLQFHNQITKKEALWCASTPGLGEDFAIAYIMLGQRRLQGSKTFPVIRTRAFLAYKALMDLSKKRMEIDLPILLDRLRIPIQCREENSQSACVIV